jgi:hypothetical protein
MHFQAFADIDTIPLQLCQGGPNSGHRPIGDIDKKHNNKVVGHYGLKKKMMLILTKEVV